MVSEGGTCEFRRPVKVALAHQSAHAAIAGGVRDEEAAIAYVGGAAWVIWFDVEAA